MFLGLQRSTRRGACAPAAVVVVVLGGAVACRPAGARQRDDSRSGAHAKLADRASTAQLPAADHAGDWPMAGRDYANTRYSPLERINRGNVSALSLAWQFTTGIRRGHEAAPLVIDGTMYVVSPFPDKGVRLRSVEARGAAEVDVRPAARSGGAGRRVL